MPRRRPYDRFAVDALIAQRDGVVRASELRRLGMGASTITHRCRAGGPWQRLLPGIILVSNGSATLSQQIRAALLYGGGGALLTGGAALRRGGVRQILDGQRLHILIPHRRHRVSTGFVVVERTTRLPNHRNVEGVPCAPVARAAIDATRRSRSVSDVRAAISEVVQRNLCSVADLGLEIRDAQNRGTALPGGSCARSAKVLARSRKPRYETLSYEQGSQPRSGITTCSPSMVNGWPARTPSGRSMASFSRWTRSSGTYRLPPTGKPRLGTDD